MAILTISRQYGSGGREIGVAVAHLLSYEYIDKERLLADIRKSGSRWEQWAESLDEHRPSVWEKFDWSFRGFVALMQSHILGYAVQDRTVIMGRGANFLLQDVAHACRLRIEARPEQRIARIMDREGVDAKKALWLAEKIDRERQGFISSVYGKGWDTAAQYDRVIMVEKDGIDAVIDEITKDLQGREPLHTREVDLLLQMRFLAARIKAAILTDPKLFVPVLDVFPEGGEIVLQGVTHSPKEHKLLEERARSLAGGHPVRCELHYRK
jgi:hypothetical protein